MSTDNQISMLDELQSLLEKQIEMARRSNLRRVEALAEQADSVVEKIVKTKTFDQPEFDAQRKHMVKLYKKLQLILAAGKDSVSRQLRQVGNVLKTLKAYRDKI
jgi:hypothetical protein